MKISVNIIAEAINGTVEGDETIEISGVSRIEEGIKGTLSFLANPKYEKYLYSTNASVVIVSKDLKLEKKVNTTLIRTENPYESFSTLLEIYQAYQNNITGIEINSQIAESAKLGNDIYVGSFSYISENAVCGDNVKIYPNAFIGKNVIIGDGTIIHSGVKIYNDCVIGSNCIIHAGTVIGADGFGFVPQQSDKFKKVPQVGNVVIEDFVEIGSNTTIDRATLGSTIIRRGVKLDNLIQVAHNVEIGENTVIAAQTGISGSTKIGQNCMIGGQVGIIGHITIADEVKIAAQSGIGKSITKKGAIVQGSPAFEVMDYQKSYVVFRKLPDLKKIIDDLQRKIKEISKSE